MYPCVEREERKTQEYRLHKIIERHWSPVAISEREVEQSKLGSVLEALLGHT